MLQERKRMFIIMLGPLLDKLIQFTYFAVDALGNIKAKTQNVRRTMLFRASSTQTLRLGSNC